MLCHREQRFIQLRRVASISRVEIGLEILVDALLRKALVKRGDNGGGKDVVVVHNAKEVIGELEVKRLVEGAFHEGLGQVGLVAEAECEGVEAVVVFVAHFFVHLVSEAEPPFLKLSLRVIRRVGRQFVELVAEALVGHEETEEVVDAGVLAEFDAVFVERGGDDFRDEVAVGADVVEEDVVVIEGVGDRIVLELGEGLLGGVVEDAAAGVGLGGGMPARVCTFTSCSMSGHFI